MSNASTDLFSYTAYGAPEHEATGLILLFHGFGANAWFMDGLARDLQQALPGVRILSLNAPERAVRPGSISVGNMRVPGEVTDDKGQLCPDQQFQWFGLSGGGLRWLIRLVRVSARVNKFADMLAGRMGLPSHKIAYAGFSQGGGVALFSGLRRKCPPGAVIAHSTYFVNFLKSLWVRSRPPLLFLYGDADEYIGQTTYRQSVENLHHILPDVEVEGIHGLTHRMSTLSRGKIVDFVKVRLNPRAQA